MPFQWDKHTHIPPRMQITNYETPHVTAVLITSPLNLKNLKLEA